MKSARLLSSLFSVAPALAWSFDNERGREPVRLSMWHQQKPVSPLGTQFKVSTPLANPLGGSLRFVENSGVCETTPGVFTASGYADLNANQSMWFWFFEARNNKSTAPLSIWLNGGVSVSVLPRDCADGSLPAWEFQHDRSLPGMQMGATYFRADTESGERPL